MTFWQRFAIGGGGALLPIIVTLLALDLPSIIDNWAQYTWGIFIGTAIRYTLLFVLGGVVAGLNTDEKSPIKLVQLGIAAPALISSYANAAVVPRNTGNAQTTSTSVNRSGALDFITPALAEDAMDSRAAEILVAQNVFSDVLTGIRGPLPPTGQPVAAGLQFNVCMGNGGGPSCANAGPNLVQYTCDQYSAIGGGGPATAPALGERLCKISNANGNQQQLPYSVVHLSSVSGGQCGWTRFLVTCLPPKE